MFNVIPYHPIKYHFKGGFHSHMASPGYVHQLSPKLSCKIMGLIHKLRYAGMQHSFRLGRLKLFP